MEKGWVTLQEKEKAHVNDSQMKSDSLAINLSKLNRHNVISNTSIKNRCLLPHDGVHSRTNKQKIGNVGTLLQKYLNFHPT